MKHLRLFNYIDMIVREGSVRRAAEKLHITASALDRRVQDLEEELGTGIFERHPRGMRLSAAGEVFLGYIRQHLSDMQRLRSEIDSLKGLRRGHVALAVSPALAADFIPRIINPLQANQYSGTDGFFTEMPGRRYPDPALRWIHSQTQIFDPFPHHLYGQVVDFQRVGLSNHTVP